MADESPTSEERREAVDAYTRDMHAYTFRLWTEVKRQAEEKAHAVDEVIIQQGGGQGNQGASSGGGGKAAASAGGGSSSK